GAGGRYPAQLAQAALGVVGGAEESRPVQQGQRAADRQQPAREGQQRGAALGPGQGPVDPAGLVVLAVRVVVAALRAAEIVARGDHRSADRKSTRLNSSHVKNSYAVFCSEKKTR